MSVHRDKERGTWRVALHIEDASGKTVTIQDSNGNVLVQGESEWTIAVEAYEA